MASCMRMASGMRMASYMQVLTPSNLTVFNTIATFLTQRDLAAYACVCQQLQTATKVEYIYSFVRVEKWRRNIHSDVIHAYKRIKQFYNLRHLETHESVYNLVLPHLIDFKYLVSLDLSQTSFGDAEMIYLSLPLLTKLNLGYTAISDVEHLSKLTQLKDLNLSGTKVDDIDHLRKLTQLRNLNLAGTIVYNLEPLASMLELVKLNLHSTRVLSLEHLRCCVSLTYLNVGNTLVSDIRPLKDVNLHTLNVWLTYVASIDRLPRSLTELDISSSRVVNFMPLASLPRLRTLNLQFLTIQSTQPLLKMTHLDTLNIRHVKFKSDSTLYILERCLYKTKIIS